MDTAHDDRTLTPDEKADLAAILVMHTTAGRSRIERFAKRVASGRSAADAMADIDAEDALLRLLGRSSRG